MVARTVSFLAVNASQMNVYVERSVEFIPDKRAPKQDGAPVTEIGVLSIGLRGRPAAAGNPRPGPRSSR